MKTIYKTVAALLVAVLVMPTVLATSVSAAPHNSFQGFITSESNKLRNTDQSGVYSTSYSATTVSVDDVSVAELYDLTANVVNDVEWYPGIVSTTLVEQGPFYPYSPIGNKYEQVLQLAPGVNATVDIEVKFAKKNKFYYLEGDAGFLTFKAFYKYSNTASGSKVTLYSELNAPGLTYDSRKAGLEASYQGIMTYFDTTGDVTVNFLYLK